MLFSLSLMLAQLKGNPSAPDSAKLFALEIVLELVEGEHSRAAPG